MVTEMSFDVSSILALAAMLCGTGEQIEQFQKDNIGTFMQILTEIDPLVLEEMPFNGFFFF